jgi:hypothetical protein
MPSSPFAHLARGAAASAVAVALVLTAGTATWAAHPGTAERTGLSDALEAGSTDDAAAASARAAAPSRAEKSPRAAASTAVSRTAVIDSKTLYDAPSYAQNVSEIIVTQDLLTGVVTARADYLEPPTPTADSSVLVYLGAWEGDLCVAHAAIGAGAGNTQTAGQFVGGGAFAVTRALNGDVLTFSSEPRSEIAAAGWNCAYANEIGPGGESFEEFEAAEFTTNFTPELEVVTATPITGARPGKWATVEFRVGNISESIASGVTLTASGSHLAFRPSTVTIGELEANRDEDFIEIAVKLKGGKPRTATFTATADGGASASTSVTIAQKAKAKKLSSLVGRYYWGTDGATFYEGWDNKGVLFVDEKWAYVGFPENGVPHCSPSVKDCAHYDYSAKKGTVRIGGKHGPIDPQGLKLGKISYAPLSIPKKGTRIGAELLRRDFNGCQGLPYCSTWTSTLVLTKGGNFVLSESSLTSLTGGAYDTYASNVAPNERGTYAVLSRGRIKLSFADGTSKVHTLGIARDVTGKPNPSAVGLLLGADNYYLER